MLQGDQQALTGDEDALKGDREAPVSLNNIETQWRCGLKSVFSGDVHTWKRNSSYDSPWMLRLRW